MVPAETPEVLTKGVAKSKPKQTDNQRTYETYLSDEKKVYFGSGGTVDAVISMYLGLKYPGEVCVVIYIYTKSSEN